MEWIIGIIIAIIAIILVIDFTGKSVSPMLGHSCEGLSRQQCGDLHWNDGVNTWLWIAVIAIAIPTVTYIIRKHAEQIEEQRKVDERERARAAEEAKRVEQQRLLDKRASERASADEAIRNLFSP